MSLSQGLVATVLSGPWVKDTHSALCLALPMAPPLSVCFSVPISPFSEGSGMESSNHPDRM